MNVYYGLSQFASKQKTAVAIGIFDGVHRGHQYLIKRMVAFARRQQLRPVVLTFYPHPAHVMHPDISLAYVSVLSQRLWLIEQLGVRDVVVLKFSKAFAQMSASVFVSGLLLKQLNAESIFVGEDFKFGKQRQGDIHLLSQMAKEYGFKFQAVKPVMSQHMVISSTRLRGLIIEGNLELARELLGRHFSVNGIVKQGDGRGKSLGFPTANIAYQAGVLPPKGVYVLQVSIQGRMYPAVGNLGLRPTFKKQESLLLEVHILTDKRLNLYGKLLEVYFIKFLREEKSFANQTLLIEQINHDISRAKKILASLRPSK
jgi:riboflavin kinase/FMN adenylyltransferase